MGVDVRMRRFGRRVAIPICAIVFLLPCSPAAFRAPPLLAQADEREPMDDAIAKGLAFLHNSQALDGSWSAGRTGTRDPAVTSLAVMAFLSAGHVPGEGKYGDTVEKGIRFVMKMQQDNGLFAARGVGNFEMYYHGICTLMVAEAIGMTAPELSQPLRERLKKAVEVILKAQCKVAGADRGGWRYTMQGYDSDISVTGWQLMALRAARNVGCDVPAERIADAVGYIRRCYDPGSGGFRYMANGWGVTVPCTGTSVLALELCGKELHRTPELLKAGGYILKNPMRPGQNHFSYGVYYTSQAMFQLGDNYWKSYRPILHRLLLRENAPKANGSWVGNSGSFDDSGWGPNYTTAMSILALTVEYRFLPIYQRAEESEEGEK